MVKTENFHESLEKSFERLGGHIERQKELPEAKELSEKELVKKSIKSLAAEIAPQVAPPPSSTPLPSYLEGGDAPEAARAAVERLVKLVFEKGLEKALVEAGRHGPFVEDAFHDALVDKLLPELKKRGMLGD